MQSALGGEQQLSVAVIDLDGLKKINDTHGHQAGDQALQTMAATLQSALRDGDSSRASGAMSSPSSYRVRTPRPRSP
jgi:diguanylate cyclase (GGDEF)-like protein